MANLILAVVANAYTIYKYRVVELNSQKWHFVATELLLMVPKI